MKTKLGKDYYYIVEELKTNYNYNRFIHVFRNGEKMPFTGTSIKDTDSALDITARALFLIESNAKKESIGIF